MTCLLAIDTATRYATVAIVVADNAPSCTVDQDVKVFSRSWFSQYNHGVELLPKIHEALENAGRSISDLTEIAVVIGPGSFSALRVGLATGQGMALAGDIQLLPILTFEVEIEPWADQDGPACAVVDAGSSGVAWGLYLPGQNGLALDRIGLDKPGDCVAACPEGTAFCGESVGKFTDHVDQALILSGEAPTRGANALVRVALRKLADGGARDPSDVEITYARAPAISTPKPRLLDGNRQPKTPRKPA